MADITVDLSQQPAYPWFGNGRTWARGYGFSQGAFCQGQSLVEYFDRAVDKDHAIQLLSSLDGFFSVVITMHDEVFAAVDHLRSMPLFHIRTPTGITITDAIGEDIVRKNSLDPRVLKYFDGTLFTVEADTLLQNVFQIRPGRHLHVTKTGRVVEEGYWRYSYEDDAIQHDHEAALELLKNGYEATFRRLVTHLNGRTAVLPLSGGHDSRLIAYYLCKLGYRNVISYTYGCTGNVESRISERVASALGIEHHFVEYGRKTGIDLFRSIFRQYALYAGNCTSVPHIQELYAVCWLLRNGIIDRTCVIVPGFSGDFLAGSWLPTNYANPPHYSKSQLVNDISMRYFSENRMAWRRPRPDKPSKDIITDVDYVGRLATEIPARQAMEAIERFNLNERQAKFIQNAVRAYEFFGLEWATPLFGRDQFGLWRRIPNELRHQRRLFFALEDEIYPSTLLSVGFAGESKKSVLFAKPRGKLRAMHAMLVPNKSHYLNTHIPVTTYYRNLLRKGQVGINQCIKNEYLAVLRDAAAGQL